VQDIWDRRANLYAVNRAVKLDSYSVVNALLADRPAQKASAGQHD